MAGPVEPWMEADPGAPGRTDRPEDRWFAHAFPFDGDPDEDLAARGRADAVKKRAGSGPGGALTQGRGPRWLARRFRSMIREFIPGEVEEDLEPLLRAYLEIWNEPPDRRFLGSTLKPFEEKTVRIWFRHHLELSHRYFAAVDEESRILGIAVVKVTPMEGVEIVGLGVRSEARRQGIGRRLVQHVVDLAGDLGFRAVDVGVFADNPAMLRLLLDLGFVPVGMKHGVRADGADCVRMKRVL